MVLLFLFTGIIGFSQKIIYSEDFESGTDWDYNNGKWDLDGNGSGSSTGATGNYLYSKQIGNTDYYQDKRTILATSPVMDITGVAELVFQFDVWYYTGVYDDGMQVQYSFNGTNWTVLGDQSTSWEDNWNYKDSIGALGNTDGWTGNSNGWLTKSIRFNTGNLGNSSPDINSQIQFRVVFAATDYKGNNKPPANSGVAFDNVVVKLEYEDPVDINDYAIFYISSVSLGGTLLNTSTGTTGAYTDYSTTVTPIDVASLGNTLEGTIKVTVQGTDVDLNYLDLWIDFDQNHYFSEAEHFKIEVQDLSNLYLFESKEVEVTLEGINIPEDAVEGNTRIRIGFSDSDSVTATDFNYSAGEVEDYSIGIGPSCSTNIWTGATSVNWNNSENWGCGEVPTNKTNVLIPVVATNHYYPTIATGDNGYANNITIETEATVTIENNYIEISGALLLNGLIDLNNEAQLIQIEGSTYDTNSTGTIEIDQQGTANTYSYNYWGSPVGSSSVSGTSTYSYILDDVLYNGDTKIQWTSELDGSTNPVTLATKWVNKYANGNGSYASWQNVGNMGTINPGEGFSMKGPSSSASVNALQTYTFKGKPNNGDINLAISANNYYLVANPYPSAIDGSQFIKDNEGNLATGTIYFWQQFKATNHVLADYQGDYAILTLSGGTVAQTNPDNSETNVDYILKKPAQYIPVGQGFFVESTNTNDGTIKFKNSQRALANQPDLDVVKSNSVFMKTSNAKSTTVDEKYLDERQKIRLGFEVSDLGYHRQLLLTVDENTTDGIDWGYEGKSFGIGKYDLYWDIEQDDYVIQALADINDDREIPLGLVMENSGTAVIKIDGLENIDTSRNIYIKDALLGETYQINDTPLEIELAAGTYVDRFSLVFKSSNSLSVANEVLEEGLIVMVNNSISEIQIKNNIQASIKNITLYNHLGQLIKTWDSNLGSNYINLPINNKSTGMYIIKINTTEGTLAKKLILK